MIGKHMQGAATPESARIRVSYRISCRSGEDPHDKARDIAFEQTVELPSDCITPELAQAVVGQVEDVERAVGDVWNAVISYPPGTVSRDVTQLFNLLFGNISLKSGVLLTDVDLPDELLSHLPGPSFGIDGLRRICTVGESRPLSCTALKPLGMTTEKLAELCYQFALGGIDIIKDDHGLANQDPAPFTERVKRCHDAVQQGNRETGGHSVYFPNLASRRSEFDDDIVLLKSLGIKGVLVSPLLIGLESVTYLAETSGLAVLTHPALSGAFFHPDHGITPELLLGKLFRVIGSDGVIYPNVGGRFVLTQATCLAINANLRAPLGEIRPVFPVPAGGLDCEQVPYWIDQYGPDTIFLIGAGLYRQGDLVTGAAQMAQALRRS